MITLQLNGLINKSAIKELLLPEDYFIKGLSNDDVECLALPTAQKTEAIKQIHDFLSQLAENNKNDHRFWYTPVSEMQPFMSCILRAVELRAGLLNHLNRARGEYVYFDSNLLLLKFIKYFFKKRIKFVKSIRFTVNLFLRIVKNFLLRYFNLLDWFLKQYKIIRQTIKTSNLPEQLDFLLVSRFEQSQESIDSTKPWHDIYLGDLPEELAKKASIAILGRCGGNPNLLADSLSQYKRFPLWTVYQFIHVKDLLQIVWQTLQFKLNIKNMSEAALARLAYQESRNHCQAIANCLLVEKSLTNLLKQVKIKKIITMQENSTWEAAVIVAAKKSQPPIPVIGYFHCPVIPSSFRYHMNKTLCALKPLPTTILTLGNEMTKAMQKLGNWSDLLVDGYAFRAPPMNYCIPTKTAFTSKSLHRILVLLGGNYDSVNFLKWLAHAFKKASCMGWQLVVKGHPRLPAEKYLQEANIPFGPSQLFTALSPFVTFDDILPSIDCVVFKGTTAGIVGLAAQLPTLHICHNSLLSDNLLFDANSFCETIQTHLQFHHALEKIKSHSMKMMNARQYALSYYNNASLQKEKILNLLFNSLEGVHDV